jgi:hypothetical protein
MLGLTIGDKDTKIIPGNAVRAYDHKEISPDCENWL